MTNSSFDRNKDENVFNAYLCSYIKKTITFSSIQIKKRYERTRGTELLCLNSFNDDYNDEATLRIHDMSINFLEEIFQPKTSLDIENIIEDKRILREFRKLTHREQEILYLSVILEKRDISLANKLGISRQAISKTRNTALKKLRKHLLRK